MKLVDHQILVERTLDALVGGTNSMCLRNFFQAEIIKFHPFNPLNADDLHTISHAEDENQNPYLGVVGFNISEEF